MVNIIFVMLATQVLIIVLLILMLLSRRENDRLVRLYTMVSQLNSSLKEELGGFRDEKTKSEILMRTELSRSVENFSDSLQKRLTSINVLQNKSMESLARQFTDLTQMNERKLDTMRDTLDKQLLKIQTDNSEKLDKIRNTVDEQLHTTLEKRLGESFKLVSDRLELVHKGLGEMKSLASGVGDLKKVLMNVKTRGTWGEIQLGSLLEDVFTNTQYEKNVATRPNSSDRVEFAIKLPGRGNDDKPVWLPIDAKFPQDIFQRLVEALEEGDASLIELAMKELESSIKLSAKGIRDKYLEPPYTTDFAIMFLPVESLYAEVLRRPGLADILQRDFRVVVAGPTTLMAVLNSLQMGFRTLAIEKRSSEVWSLLGTVKNEFIKFGGILEKTHKKIQEASNTIESATRKTRTIERKLKKVEEYSPEKLPAFLLNSSTVMDSGEMNSSEAVEEVIPDSN